MRQDEPSEMSHYTVYTANTFHTPNEEIAQYPRQPKPPTHISRSYTRTNSQRKPSSFPCLRRTTTLQLVNTLAPAPNTWRSIQAIIFASWLNVLLVFIPISWAIKFALPDQHTLMFIFTFLAIIPLAKLLAFAIEELSLRVDQTLAGLLNATFGNAVELIVSIIALAKYQLGIVQSSLVGSILSNLLLVLGMCFSAGGLLFSEQGFGQSAVQLNSSLLTISVIAVLLPGAFHMVLQGSTQYDEPSTDYAIVKTSHDVAIIILFIYASYLIFQLFSHKALYDDVNEDARRTKAYEGEILLLHRRCDWENNSKSNVIASTRSEGVTPDDVGHINHFVASESDADVESLMNLAVSLWPLAIVTVLVAVAAKFLVHSIDGLTESGPISKHFVGVILLPIVGNAAEHVTAVIVSIKDKLTLSLGVAVGSSIQIALFVISFIVILGWIMGKSLTLLFDQLESVVMFLSVLTVNFVVQDCKSNWLEGMILMCLYMILAVTFWYYPGSHSTNSDSRRHSAY